MSDSVIAVSEGSGKNYRANERTIASTTTEEIYVQRAEPANPTYVAMASSIATTTSASHLMFIMADGTNYTRIKRIYIEQVVGASAATLIQLQVFRLSTAGSGGTTVTARGLDAADTYAGTIQTLPTVKGTEGVQLLQKRMQLLTTAQVAATTVNPTAWEWLAHEEDGRKPIVFGTTSTDGIAIKIVTGITTGTLDLSVTFTTDTAL